MTNLQIYLFAQAYGSGLYGGQTYQCTGEQCETQAVDSGSGSAVPGVPSTGIFTQAGGVGVYALILLASVAISAAILLLKKRAQNKR